ncbi:transporter [Mycobacteroides saopaulense]|uniref:lipopolysaccharide biosynthesis protein n=1 Tax=Mycobacteroides saopaulense TaxID=1578165 RepID=UPI0007216407|nr:lipopolysaccharide biosynthesis protein [Mycobacteroides saopaulense]ALR10819.1 transporter [Mycobacteroides saopaulense]
MSEKSGRSTTLPRALRLARDFGAVVFGKYGQYLVTFATVPLLARILGPAGMGLLAVGMAAYFFGSIVVDLGMTPFLAARVPELRNTPAELGQVRSDYVALRLMTLGVLGIAFGVGWIFGVPPYAHMILLGLFAGGLWATSEDWLLIGQGRFVASALYQGSGRITYLVLLVVLLPHSPHASTAVLCLLGSSILTVAGTWWDSLRTFGAMCRPYAPGQILRTSWPIVTSRLLTTGYGQGAPAIYSAMLDAISLGLFSASDRLVRAMQSLLDMIGLVLLPRMARRSAHAHFWRSGFQGLRGAVAVAVLAAAVLWVLAAPIVRVIFGNEFLGAIDLLRAELLILPASTISSYISTALLPVRQDTHGVLIASVVGTTASVAGLIAASWTHSVWALIFGVIGAEFCVALWYLARIRHLSGREQDLLAETHAAQEGAPR